MIQDAMVFSKSYIIIKKPYIMIPRNATCTTKDSVHLIKNSTKNNNDRRVSIPIIFFFTEGCLMYSTMRVATIKPIIKKNILNASSKISSNIFLYITIFGQRPPVTARIQIKIVIAITAFQKISSNMFFRNELNLSESLLYIMFSDV